MVWQPESGFRGFWRPYHKMIYKNKRLKPFLDYSELVLNSIFDVLKECYRGEFTFYQIGKLKRDSETLVESFSKWLARNCDFDIVPEELMGSVARSCANKKIYHKLEIEEIYYQAIIDYITGMTDRYAIKVFDELLAY